MSDLNRPVHVKAFATDRAGIKIPFSEQKIVDVLKGHIKSRVEKEGFQMSESAVDTLVIDGEFVIIDQGNQFLRWLIGPFGVGCTKLEVEGSLKVNDNVHKKFSYSRKGRGGFFGGNSENLLMNSCRGISKEIVNLLKLSAKG